jgi:predicted O-methyltransferase YrrM
MDSRIERLLQEYEQRGAAEATLATSLPTAEAMARRDEFLLPVGRSTGSLLNILGKESKATRILELGTSYGYSTVWLAEAAHATGGKVITLELQPEKSEYARGKLQSVGLAASVDFRVGDALDILASLQETFDFVLVDLWKDLYVPCLELFTPKLRKDALVVADNMLFPEMSRPDAALYRRAIRSSGRFDSVLLPVGSGIELSRYLGG